MTPPEPDPPPPLGAAPASPIELSGGASLVRCDPALAPSAVAAINDSLDHLSPWMAWAAEPATIAGMTTFFAASAELWDQRRDFGYSIIDASGAAIGGCGLHNRLGPGALEIGYWVHVDAGGRGLATEAAGALTEAALTLTSVERVEIHCEEQNHRSARVPAKLGFTFRGLEVPEGGPCAGRSTQIWVVTEPEWRARTS